MTTVDTSAASPDAAETDVMLPYRVVARTRQTGDTVTLTLEPERRAVRHFRPGQFMMLYRFGVGEIPMSISGDPHHGDLLEHTIRAVGAVSRALQDTPVGGRVGVRGPFGVGWDLESAGGRDLVIVGGGCGAAPLRPVVLGALGARATFGRVVVIMGARTPADLMFAAEQQQWAATGSAEVYRTVDTAGPGWTGAVGVVTEPLAGLTLDPSRTTAFVCGPEAMIRFCARTLLRHGVAATDIRVSLERNMQCGVGHCGHCQLGPLLLCRDGPVTDYATAGPLLEVEEL
ncbi:FAD/NAD(P)-binding protein [Nocardia stercoris]|uniref:Oxidoreductase n=1 Tax=Nocardia stercoris TaxID=2483361 RepID=A0A3M2LAF2_9NOCA|nr:FAD/NAD(P)-binding protein [Nocardia stercoris]RMI33543.1 oxidoreductase [Nocardia stercoris]